MELSKKTRIFIIASICLVYVLLRLWKVTDSCLWFDEIFSVHAAEHSWSALWWFVAQDLIHPPMFYVLLKIWISIGGDSLFWLRFFPVLFSTLALIPFLLLCRELKLTFLTVALSLTFFAFNGSLIKYAQEVRMYSLLLCISLFSMWLFVRFLNTGKNFIALILVNILLVYSHYFGWLMVMTEVLAACLLAREKLKRILLMASLTALSFAPWIYAVWQATKINAGFGQNLGWMNKPDLVTIFQFVFDLFEPLYFQQSSDEQTSNFLISIPILLMAAAAFVFWLVNKNRSLEDAFNFKLLLIFIAAPAALAFTASWILPYSVWGTRHLIIVFAPLAILLSIILSKIHIRELKLAGIGFIYVLLMAAFLFQFRLEQTRYIWCAWESLAQDLGRVSSNERVKLYVFEDAAAYHFWFALRYSDRRIQIIKVNGIEGLSEDKAYFLPRGFDAVQSTNALEGNRFFIAFRDGKWDENSVPLKNLLESGYRLGAPQVFEAQGFKAFLTEVQKK